MCFGLVSTHSRTVSSRLNHSTSWFQLAVIRDAIHFSNLAGSPSTFPEPGDAMAT